MKELRAVPGLFSFWHREQGPLVVLGIGADAEEYTGDQDVEYCSCDAGCHRVRAGRCLRRFCGTGEWLGYC
jgi:hypothetical protein